MADYIQSASEEIYHCKVILGVYICQHETSNLSVLFSSMASPMSSRQCATDRHPSVDLSPQSAASSPSPSRLTYISMNDGSGMPVSEHQKVLQGEQT